MKIFSYVIIIFGILFLVIQEYIIGTLVFAAGVLLLNRRKLKKNNVPISQSMPSKTKLATDLSQSNQGKKPQLSQTRTHMKFHVAGINYDGREKLIEKYLAEYNEPYDGMTTNEMKEYDDMTFYMHEKIIDNNAVEFVFEPNNKFDPNAIAIYHNPIGMIGYVPADRTDALRKFLEKGKEHTTEIEFYGGPYKHVYDGKIESNKDDYKATLRILTPLKG